MFARTKWNECYKFKFREIERREREREKYKHSTQFDIIFIRNRDTFPPKAQTRTGKWLCVIKSYNIFSKLPQKEKNVYEFVYVYFNRDRHTFVRSEIHPIKWLEIKLHGPTNEWMKEARKMSFYNQFHACITYAIHFLQQYFKICPRVDTLFCIINMKNFTGESESKRNASIRSFHRHNVDVAEKRKITDLNRKLFCEKHHQQTWSTHFASTS